LLRLSWSGRVLALFGAAAAATLAGLAGTIAPAASALPVPPLPLHESHRNSTAAGFPTKSCAQIPGEAPVTGRDGFVFVLPGNDADFVELTLQFKTTAGATVTVKIPDPNDSNPDGITTNGTSKAWVLVPLGWTLLDGSAVVSGETRTDDFNLTHTCPGTPGTPPSSSSSSAPPSQSASPSVSPSGSVSPEGTPTTSGTTPPPSQPGSGGGLPLTGVAVQGVALGGAALIVAGALLLLLRRGRSRVEFTSE
jgi:hypothetical protein